MEIITKRINLEEINEVVNLFNDYRIFYKQVSDIERAENFLKNRLENNESVIIVAFLKNETKSVAVGFTQLYPKYSSMRTSKNWILNDLYVDINHRNLGIGKKLIIAAETFALETNASTIELETAVDNYSAQTLYHNTGFTKQEPDQDFLKYKKSLI